MKYYSITFAKTIWIEARGAEKDFNDLIESEQQTLIEEALEEINSGCSPMEAQDFAEGTLLEY